MLEEHIAIILRRTYQIYIRPQHHIWEDIKWGLLLLGCDLMYTLIYWLPYPFLGCG